MRKIYHIGRSADDCITEGGVSRDLAFSRALGSLATRIQVGRGRLRNLYEVFKFLLLPPKASVVVIHYPNIGVPVSDKTPAGQYIRKLYVLLVERLARTNVLCVDVADIPCEQALDLGLPIPRYYEDIEFRLFNAAKVLMPASGSMQKMIVSKYPQLKSKNSIVCNNGGAQYFPKGSQEKNSLVEAKGVKFVYAGTLNKGRSIETLLDLFQGSRNTLFLLGAGGDWIPDRIRESRNILYLGELSEREAFRWVSDCDVGLIPYDSTRHYYNVAYPTKLSFYVAAGIPYLCTPVVEALEIHRRYECGWILPIDQWQEVIDGIDAADLASRKKSAIGSSNDFTWESTLEPFLKFLQQESLDLDLVD